MTDQTRANFEAHFQLTTRQAWQHPDGSYKFPEIQAKWEGYQAGVAKAAPERDTLAHGGMQAAAEYIDAKADKYLQDYAHTEGDTGATVFHYGEAGREYHSSLVELAEELRAQLAAAAPGAEK